MKQLVCEACGGKELIRQGDVLVCSYCDTKYSVKEDKKDFKININIEQEPFETITEFFESKKEHFRTETEENNFNDFSQSFFADADSSKSYYTDFDWTTLFYLSLFLGWLGADRFYVGKKTSGVIKLLLFLFSLIIYISPLSSAPIIFIILLWWLIDLVCISHGEFAGFQKESKYH